MKKLIFICGFFVIAGCASGIDFQPKKKNSIDIGANYKDIQAKASTGQEYQDLAPQAQVEYINAMREYKMLELLLNSPKITDETTRQYLISLRTPEKIKKAIEESPNSVITAKTELVDAITTIQKSIPEKSLESNLQNFVNNYGDIDLHIECNNKPEYMKRYRQAETLLNLIEIQANQQQRTDIINKFVIPNRTGIHSLIDCE